jgi:energy-coupling factor transporter transmembrane protein EcfT
MTIKKFFSMGEEVDLKIGIALISLFIFEGLPFNKAAFILALMVGILICVMFDEYYFWKFFTRITYSYYIYWLALLFIN